MQTIYELHYYKVRRLLCQDRSDIAEEIGHIKTIPNLVITILSYY